MADFSKSLEAFGLTDVGRKRKRNEDFFRYVIPTANTPEEALGAFFVVADGIGGMGFGEEASSVAVNTLLAAYYDLQNPEPDPLNRLKSAMQIANNAVIAKAGELGRTLIGTTASGIIVHPKEVVLFNVGDARVYRLRGTFIERLSRDQSVLEEQLAQGLITEEEAAQGRNMNVTAFLGQPGGVEPVYRRVNAQSDDIFLICSDGLWDLVRENELMPIITNNPPDVAMQQLVTMVLERGAPDNTTGIIVRITPFNKRANAMKPAIVLMALAIMIGIAIGVVLVLSNNSTAPATDIASTATSSDVIVLVDGETVTPTSNLVIIEETPDDSESTPIVVTFVTQAPTTEETETVEITEEVTLEITEETTPEEPASVANIAPTETEITVEPTATPTTTPTDTATDLPSPTPTVTATSTSTTTNTPRPTITNSPTVTQTSTPSATITTTPTPSPTLDETSSAIVYSLELTARASRPVEEQTALSAQDTRTVESRYEQQTQSAIYATETAVFPITASAMTLQAVQTRVSDIQAATATYLAENPNETPSDIEVEIPSAPNILLVASEGVTLYRESDVRSEALLSLIINDQFTVYGIAPNGRWLYVESVDGIAGWIDRFANNNLNSVVLGTPIEALPMIDPENPTAPSEDLFGVHLVVIGDLSINVREYAFFEDIANVFEGLDQFEVARITETTPNQSWLRVSFVNSRNRIVSGWVSALLSNDDSIMIVGDLDAVRKINPLPLPTVTPSTPTTPTATPTETETPPVAEEPPAEPPTEP
jgi:protein phosphatase